MVFVVTFVVSRGEYRRGYLTRGRKELESNVDASLLGQLVPGATVRSWLECIWMYRGGVRGLSMGVGMCAQLSRGGGGEHLVTFWRAIISPGKWETELRVREVGLSRLVECCCRILGAGDG
jgi:hypothetical protein